MTLMIGSLQLGCIYGLLAVGVYLAFRILDIPDLSAEGTFTFGLAVSAALTAKGHPLLGIPMGFLAGCLGGAVTGFLQTKLRIHPILAGILTMSGLYSINLAIMGSSSNISLVDIICRRLWCRHGNSTSGVHRKCGRELGLPFHNRAERCLC